MTLVCLSTPFPTKLWEAACLRGSNLNRAIPGFQLVSRLMQALKSGLSHLNRSTGNLGQVQTEIEKFTTHPSLVSATPQRRQNLISLLERSSRSMVRFSHPAPWSS